jgi:hypothetical protein
MSAYQFIPRVDGPEGAFSNFVLNCVENIIRICTPMQSSIDAHRDGFGKESSSLGELAEADCIDSANEVGLYVVQSWPISDRECSQAPEQLEVLRAGRDTISWSCPDTWVINVARGEATDGDNECGKSRLSPLIWVAIILSEVRNIAAGQVLGHLPIGMLAHAGMGICSKLSIDNIVQGFESKSDLARKTWRE